MTGERELLLHSLRPGSPSAGARIRDLLSGNLNWDILLWDAHWHRAAAAVRRAVLRHAAAEAPPQALALLRRHARASATSALHRMAILRRAVTALSDADVVGLAGRGPALAAAYLGSAADRDPESSTEVLVRPDDLARATEALNRAGIVTERRDDTPAEITVRAHLSRHAGIGITDALLSGARDVVAGIPIPGTSELLVLLSASLAGRPWDQAFRLGDFVAVLDRADAAQIALARTRAAGIGLSAPLETAIDLATDLAGDAVGSRVSRRLLRGTARMTMDDVREHRASMAGQTASLTDSLPPDDLGEFLPNTAIAIDAMLTMAEAQPSDVLFDLGCGDGAVLVQAAEHFGLRAVGIEWDAERVAHARARVRDAGLADRIEIRQGDVHTADLRDATLVYTYLRGAGQRLIPRLRRDLRPGARLVSRDFDYGEWPPRRTDILSTVQPAGPIWLFLWVVGRSD